MTRCTRARSNPDAAQSPQRPTARTDWASGRGLLLIWGLPAGVLVLSALFNAPYRSLVWPALLTAMGVACLLNARRCARTHCYISGPFFLSLAVVAGLNGVGLLPLGVNGWRLLSWILLVGGAALIYAPDRLLGRYRVTASDITCP